MNSWILSASVLIAAVLAVRRIFRGRINPRFQYALWLLVLLRLLLPVNVGQSAASVMNFLPVLEAPAVIQAPAENHSAAAPTAALAEPVQALAPAQPDQNQAPAASEKVPAPAAVPVQKDSLDLARLLPGAWLAGIAVVLLCLLFSNLRFALRLRRSRKKAGIYRKLPVYECAWLETPCMFGLLHPAIYLSPGLDGDSRDYALRHEYGHFHQGDHLWALFRGLCLALHWYNPLVWLALRLSKRDGELACDQWVTQSLTEAQCLDYGRTLIRLSCSGREPVFCTATTMSVKGKALKQRIEYIAKRPTMLLSTSVVLLLAVLLSVGCTFTGAKEGEPAAPIPEEPVAQEPSPTVGPVPTADPVPAGENGRLLDRKGQALDLSQYPDLSPAEESFAAYLQMGYDVHLTIDQALQQQAQTLLAETVPYGEGAIVMVDVKTGAPLVLASNGRNGGLSLLRAYQPRNLFLPCTAIAAQWESIVTSALAITCEGVFDKYQQDGWVSTCWIWEASDSGLTHGEENLTAALRDSCYYYFYTVGNDLGNDDLVEYAKALGLGQPTGIELPESTGTLASRKTPLGTGAEWRIGDTLEAAVGRSVNAFTPLQMAEYCAAIANRGQRHSASILGSITNGAGKTRYLRQTQVTGTVLDEQELRLAKLLEGWSDLLDANWAAVHEGMYAAVNDESYNLENARHWQGCPWGVAGMAYPGMFMGFAPYENPQVAIFVFADETRNSEDAQEIARGMLDFYIEEVNGI